MALCPEAAVFRATLAEAYRALGRFDRAVGCCHAALQLGLERSRGPQQPRSGLEALGRHAEAAVAFRAALELRPDDAMAHTNLGTALARWTRRTRLSTTFAAPSRSTPISPPLEPTSASSCSISASPTEALPHCQQAVALAAQPARGAQQPGQRSIAPWAGYAEARHVLRRGDPARPRDGAGPRQPRPDVAAGRAVGRGTALAQAGDRARARTRWFSWPCWPRPPSSESCLTKPSPATRGCWISTPAWRRLTTRSAGSCRKPAALTSRQSTSETALRLRPDFAIAHVNLGGIHEKLGDFAAAEACFRAGDLGRERRARRPWPGWPCCLRGKLPDADLRADRTSDWPARTARIRRESTCCSAWLASGMLAGAYSRAAECAREANRLAGAQLERRNRAYQPAEHEQLGLGVDRMRSIRPSSRGCPEPGSTRSGPCSSSACLGPAPR